MESSNNQQNHIGNALLFMCRYSYSRRTSADMACNSELKSLWGLVPDSHKQKILEEIKSEANLDEYGSLWQDFLYWEENKCWNK